MRRGIPSGIPRFFCPAFTRGDPNLNCRDALFPAPDRSLDLRGRARLLWLFVPPPSCPRRSPVLSRLRRDPGCSPWGLRPVGPRLGSTKTLPNPVFVLVLCRLFEPFLPLPARLESRAVWSDCFLSLFDGLALGNCGCFAAVLPRPALAFLWSRTRPLGHAGSLCIPHSGGLAGCPTHGPGCGGVSVAPSLSRIAADSAHSNPGSPPRLDGVG